MMFRTLIKLNAILLCNHIRNTKSARFVYFLQLTFSKQEQLDKIEISCDACTGKVSLCWPWENYELNILKNTSAIDAWLNCTEENN